MKRNVLVFGASGALGRAMVDEIRQASPSEIYTPTRVELDLSSASSSDCTTFIQSIGIEGGLDGLVYSAGINFPKPIPEISEEELLKTTQTNTLGFFKVVQACLPMMRDANARVVAISSIYGSISRAGRTAYSISKAALEGAVRAMAVELAPDGILVNAVSPGFVLTPLTEQNNSPAQIEELISQIPLRRLANSDEIAKVVDFLIDKNRNTFLTGQNIIVDGGFSIV